MSYDTYKTTDPDIYRWDERETCSRCGADGECDPGCGENELPEPHSCDESCGGCPDCYLATGDTVCDKTCQHAAEA